MQRRVGLRLRPRWVGELALETSLERIEEKVEDHHDPGMIE